MKKGLTTALLIAALALTACGKSLTITSSTEKDKKNEEVTVSTASEAIEKVNTPTSEPTPEPTPTVPAPKAVAIGDVIVTSTKEITVKRIELTNEVLPDDTSGFYQYYEAEPGEVILHVDVEVKNLSKSNLACNKIMSVSVDYNDGYKYTADAVPEDSSLGFTYANITAIAPLAQLGVRFLAFCPEEVDTSTDKPLLIIFKIDDEEYVYQMR